MILIWYEHDISYYVIYEDSSSHIHPKTYGIIWHHMVRAQARTAALAIWLNIILYNIYIIFICTSYNYMLYMISIWYVQAILYHVIYEDSASHIQLYIIWHHMASYGPRPSTATCPGYMTRYDSLWYVYWSYVHVICSYVVYDVYMISACYIISSHMQRGSASQMHFIAI